MKYMPFDFKLSAVLCSLLIFVATALVSCNKSKTQVEGTDELEILTEDTDSLADIIDIPEGLTIRGVKVSKPVYDKESDTYAFDVKVSLSGCDKLPPMQYTLDCSADPEYHVECTDGKFKDVRPLKAGSYYTLKVSCDSIASQETQIPSEEMPEIPKLQRVSPKDIEAKLNDASMPLMGHSESISPDCVFVFQNLDEDNKVESLQKIYECIEFDWSSVSVVDLGFDEFNRVNKMVLKINY